MLREIPKLPENVPLNFSKDVQNWLTELCFREESILTAPILFCFGTHQCPEKQAEVIQRHISQGIVQKVILTGGRATYNDIENPFVEAERVFSYIDAKKYPKVEFYLEKESKNTLENVQLALKLFDFREVKKVLFCSHSYSAGRSYLTLRRFLPKAEILQQTFNIQLQGEELTRENWFLTQVGRQYVWGEFLRIVCYGTRHDIAFEEVEKIATKIMRARQV